MSRGIPTTGRSWARSRRNSPRTKNYPKHVPGALSRRWKAAVYQALKQRLPDATMVSIGHRPTLRQWHDRRLELQRQPGQVGRLVELPAT